MTKTLDEPMFTHWAFSMLKPSVRNAMLPVALSPETSSSASSSLTSASEGAVIKDSVFGVSADRMTGANLFPTKHHIYSSSLLFLS